MSLHVPICVLILAFASTTRSVSSKVDFVEEEEAPPENTSKEDEDVEVKHTIVVSTKLKNNNRRALVSDAETGALTYNIGNRHSKKDDSGEVPIVKAYKSVETTQIRTPDTRQKLPVYSNYVPTSRNSPDEMDLYPNLSFNQWKPTTLYKNINYWNQDRDFVPFTINRPDYQKINRRISDDGVREFYCKKCRELSGPRGCIQERSNSWILESTTPKMKIDGKIAKLN